MNSSLPLDPATIIKIRIGTGINENMQDAVVLTESKAITSFLKDFSFGGEREFTVKHPLPGYVEFHSSNGEVAHFRFENTMMRYQMREYVLSSGTARMLQKHLD